MATYVEGEAPETDSEDEAFSLSQLKIKGTNKVIKTKEFLLKGNVIEGIVESNTHPAVEIDAIYPNGPPQTPAEFFYENELLKKKINEVASTAFRNYVQSALAPISKQLIETDNSLINTQLTLQNATTTIKKVNDRYELIHERLINLIDCNFLSNVKRLPQT